MFGSETSEYANPRQPDNFRVERRPNFDGPAFGGIREACVNSISVVVGGVVAKEPTKVVLAQHDHVIDEFALAGSDPSLRGAVLPRAPGCGSFRRDADRLDLLQDLVREKGVVVEDQVARCGIVGERLAELLADPGRCWVGGDIEMDDPTPLVVDEEAIEWGQPRLRLLLIVAGKLLPEGELDDHLLAVAAKESRNASHDECQEMERGLHGDRDVGGPEAAIRV
jgi:hypothetical protein